MRIVLGLAAAVAGLASIGRGQPFDLPDRMLPGDRSAASRRALRDLDGDGDLGAFVGNAAIGGGLAQVRLCLNAEPDSIPLVMRPDAAANR